MALTDLFRPRWKHSDVAVRETAVAELDLKHLEVLKEIAGTDEAVSVRLVAVARIDDRSTLEQLVGQDNDMEVLQAIAGKLDLIQKAVACSNGEVATRVGAVHQIRDEKVLADLAESADCGDVRTAAVQRLSCEKLLARVALASCGRDTADAAVDRLQDETLLEQVARKGGNKAARKAAKAKLDVLRGDRDKPSIMEIRGKELTQITDEAEQLSRSYNWTYAAETFEKWKVRWENLDCNDQFAELHARFNTAATYFDGRYQAFQEREAKEKAEREAKEAALASRKALLETIVAQQGQWGEDAEVAVDAAVAAWAELEPLEDADAETLEAQFDAGVKAFRRDAKKLARTFADAEAKRTAALALHAKADEWADCELDGIAEAVKQLRRGLKEIGDPGDDEAVQAAVARAKEVADALSARRDAEKAAADAAEKERLDNAEAQIAIIEQQLEAEDRRAAQAAVKDAVAAFKAVGHVPRKLHGRYKQACDAFYEKQREYRQEASWEQFGNRTRAEELAVEAEALKDNNDMPKVAKTVRDLRKQWKDNGHLGPEGQDIWERFNGACVAAGDRAHAWFKQRDAERAENLEKKRALCVRAEELAQSSHWRDTTAKFKELQAEWKTIGHVPKDDADAVWQRFRAACDQFFNRMRAANEERDRSRQVNLDAKNALVEEAVALQESEEWSATARKYKNLQARWKEAGPAPRREQDQEVWEKFRGACDHFFERLAAVKPANLAAKQELVKEAEALVAEADAEESNRDSIAGKLMELQRRWKDVGPVPPEESEAVWEAFHGVCDKFFAGRKEEQERNAEAKQALIATVAEMATSDDWRDAASEIKAAQKQWQTVGHAGEAEKSLYADFRGHCDQFFKRRDRFVSGLEDNLKKKQEICARIESLAGIEVKDSGEKKDEGLSLAEELQLAFETNFIASGSSQKASADAARQEVQSLQHQWQDVGPVPHRDAKAINSRYRAACDAFFEKSRPKRKEIPADESAANEAKLSELATKAQALAADSPAEQVDAVKRLLRDWRKVGQVNNGKTYRELRTRFDSACDTVFEAAREQEEAQIRF
jgi:hypothetical protein